MKLHKLSCTAHEPSLVSIHDFELCFNDFIWNALVKDRCTTAKLSMLDHLPSSVIFQQPVPVLDCRLQTFKFL